MLSEITQIEKDEQNSLVCGVNFKKSNSQKQGTVEKWLPGTREMLVKDYIDAVGCSCIWDESLEI